MDRKITLTTKTSFELHSDELQRFYSAMALLQYHHHRTPDYREAAMLQRLRNEFGRYNAEITKACEKDPNNLALNQIQNFINHHYGYLKKVCKGLE